MELSSIHEDNRYISRSEHKHKRNTSYRDSSGLRGADVVEDQREDVTQDPERPTWTGNIANTVHTMFCQAPCFVNTSNSMDGSYPPNSRMEAPTSPIKSPDDMMALSGSSLHAPPSPPIQFPSIHLEADNWDCAEDSAYFHSSRAGVPLVEGRLGTPVHTHQSIYRSPSNLSEAFSKVTHSRSSNRTISNSGASQASTIASRTTNKVGLYRSPAWIDDDDDDEDSDIVSIADDEDDCWQDGGANYGNQNLQDFDETKTVIDVTHIEDLFNDFNVSDAAPLYGSDRRM